MGGERAINGRVRALSFAGLCTKKCPAGVRKNPPTCSVVGPTRGRRGIRVLYRACGPPTGSGGRPGQCVDSSVWTRHQGRNGLPNLDFQLSRALLGQRATRLPLPCKRKLRRPRNWKKSWKQQSAGIAQSRVATAYALWLMSPTSSIWYFP